MMNRYVMFVFGLLICGMVVASDAQFDASNEFLQFDSETELGLEFDSCPVPVSPAPPAFFAPMNYCTNGVQGYRCFILGKNPNCPSYCVCRPQ